jgi:hypothetical protein
LGLGDDGLKPTPVLLPQPGTSRKELKLSHIFHCLFPIEIVILPSQANKGYGLEFIIYPMKYSMIYLNMLLEPIQVCFIGGDD